MAKITKKEIQDVLEKLEELTDSECSESRPEEISYYSNDEEYSEACNGLKFKQEASGRTGSYFDKAYVVFKVTKGEESVFIKFDGYYSSYDGSSYDDGFVLVEPYMKEVRDWKVVK